MNTGNGVSVRRSAEQWREIMSTFESGGQTSVAFCAAEGLSLRTFQKWKRQFNGAGEVAPARESTRKGFVELADTPAGASGWDVEVDLGEGLVLRLRRASRC